MNQGKEYGFEEDFPEYEDLSESAKGKVDPESGVKPKK